VLELMVKRMPTSARLLGMAVFTISVFGILMFLWLAFGGSIPLKPEGYRFTVHIPEAATLAEEADVRMAGVNVGKVKSKELDAGAARTIVEVELDDAYAPIASDTRAILRQKTLLGETYMELSPGHRASGTVDDGGRLANARVEETAELDEIFSAFDPATREAFRDWVKELSGAIERGGAEDLSDALGNFEGFAVDGAELVTVLDEQGVALQRLVRNTGEVFGAINERQGALRELIVNSKRTFEATADRDQALADTIEIFPTFLDESRVTAARLEEFARKANPVVNDLKGPADDLAPTLRDLGDLGPDLERLFADLDPLVRAGEDGVPALERTLREAEPLAEGLHVFLPELNPILSYAGYHQQTIASFISNAASDLAADYGTGQRGQTQIAIFEDRSLQGFPWGQRPPDWARGNAYLAPNGLERALTLGGVESFDCPGGQRRDPEDATGIGETNADKRLPCILQPPSLFDGRRFPYPRRGEAPLREPPHGNAGSPPASNPAPPR
jgi:phospholipid/cholesterol/gamma-HCH transport system substrate-binding protein